MIQSHRAGFAVGDDVEFEMSKLGYFGEMETPRWSGGNDYGATGVWCSGDVCGWDPSQDLWVRYKKPSSGEEKFWIFPFECFALGLDGWVRLLRGGMTQVVVCECGAIATWGTGPHSGWCPMAKTGGAG